MCLVDFCGAVFFFFPRCGFSLSLNNRPEEDTEEDRLVEEDRQLVAEDTQLVEEDMVEDMAAEDRVVEDRPLVEDRQLVGDRVAEDRVEDKVVEDKVVEDRPLVECRRLEVAPPGLEVEVEVLWLEWQW